MATSPPPAPATTGIRGKADAAGASGQKKSTTPLASSGASTAGPSTAGALSVHRPVALAQRAAGAGVQPVTSTVATITGACRSLRRTAGL